jgi:P4 family phage/plasmid primase-like protien
MNFQEIARMADQGVIFVGANPGMTRSNWLNWQNLGTDDKSKLKEWIDHGYNLVAVATHGHQFMIDKDDPAACKAMGMREPFPEPTYEVDTPSGGEHLYGLHDAVTETLGNLVVVYAEPGNLKSKKILELKLNGPNSVAAPTAVRLGQPGKCDGVYKPRDQKNLAKGLNPEFVEWLSKYGTFVGASKSKGAIGTAPKLHPTFELDDHLEHNKACEARSYNKHGVLHVVSDTCPLNGGPHRDADVHEHVHDRVTEFIYGKHGWGFSCMVCNVFTKAEFEKKMQELDPEWEPYPYYVYEDEDDEIVLKILDAEPLSDVHEPEEAQSVSPDGTTKEVASPTHGYTYSLDDTGNGERLVRLYGKYIRHIYETEWMVWGSNGWEQDGNGKLMRMTKSVIRELVDGAGDDNVAWVHAKKSASVYGRKAMIASASVEKGIITKISEWDSDKWLLNVKNGVIDLKTQTFRERTQADMCRKQANVTYDPEAKCPLWDVALLKYMSGDQTMVDFLARYVGYSLTGDTGAQSLIFNMGDGSNGKDTFTSTVARMMGSYAADASFKTFVDTKNHSEHRNDLAILSGAIRFLTSCEGSDGHSLDEGVIKRVTGQSPVTCRHIHGKPFTYSPEYKLWFSSNYEPAIKGQDIGIWRRVKRVPWDYTITEAEKIEDFEKVLCAELSGILNWALRGLDEYVKAGKMIYHSKIDQATAQYKDDMDIIGRFLRERCAMRPDATVLGNEMYGAYTDWCRSNGFYPANSRKFYAEFRKRYSVKVKEVKSKNGAVFHGVRLFANGNGLMPEDALEVCERR